MDDILFALETLRGIEIEGDFKIGDGERKRYKYAEGNDWEILLLVWGKNAKTPIHDHNGSQGWIRMVEGNLIELCFDKSRILQRKNVLGVDTETYIDDSRGTHQIINEFQSKAISLHLYSPPITNCSIYDEISNEWKPQKLENHSFEEVFIK
ncbi:cysteine dioxygenase [Leptospira harrisiae]|uniref:Cysteine dioxygenase n=1 Tax=Leptospira harrisiae TaxID=2023189 RepID=A0A2N0AMW1_9LEPT|nr:cysteine dioxygenase family protein [Leptospira harrisiae]PJZ85575.1 hypothetical protein CH364_05000 [Leptospira harrisiae]PKA09111.1 hypothetical protein CH366_05140 [Leptospira harrisiae]